MNDYSKYIRKDCQDHHITQSYLFFDRQRVSENKPWATLSSPATFSYYKVARNNPRLPDGATALLNDSCGSGVNRPELADSFSPAEVELLILHLGVNHGDCTAAHKGYELNLWEFSVTEFVIIGDSVGAELSCGVSGRVVLQIRVVGQYLVPPCVPPVAFLDPLGEF